MLVLVANFVLIPDHRMRARQEKKKEKERKGKKGKKRRNSEKGLLMYGSLEKKRKKRGNVFSFGC